MRPYSCFTARPGASLRRRVDAACGACACGGACASRRHSRRRWCGHAATPAAAHAHARCFCGASGAVLTRWQFVGARVAAASAARSDRDVMLPRCGVAAGARRPRGGVGGRAHVRARAFERRHLYIRWRVAASRITSGRLPITWRELHYPLGKGTDSRGDGRHAGREARAAPEVAPKVHTYIVCYP